MLDLGIYFEQELNIFYMTVKAVGFFMIMKEGIDFFVPLFHVPSPVLNGHSLIYFFFHINLKSQILYSLRTENQSIVLSMSPIVRSEPPGV